MDASTFRFMRLPKACSQHVLRILIPNELIAISLLSNRCKNLVQSIGMKAEKIICNIRHSISIAVKINRTSCLFLDFHFTNTENGKVVLEKPTETVQCRFHRLDSGYQNYRLLKNDMEVKEWWHHLQFLFGKSKCIAIGFSEQAFRYDIDSLKESFPEIRQLEVAHTGCYRYNKLVLRKFLPVEILWVSPGFFQNSRIPREILIQNTDFICIRKPNGQQSTHTKLNDLLLMNSRKIEIPNYQNSLKEFNMFLKLWMKGANPNLESIYFRYRDPNIENTNTLMKGIKHQTMPRTLARAHRKVCWIAYGGSDFHRYDGLKATVLVWPEMAGEGAIAMLVWHDHCIMPNIFPIQVTEIAQNECSKVSSNTTTSSLCYECPTNHESSSTSRVLPSLKELQKSSEFSEHPTKPIAIIFAQQLFIKMKFQGGILTMKINFHDEPQAQEENWDGRQITAPKSLSMEISRDNRISEKCVWDTNQRIELQDIVQHLQFVFPNSKDILFNFMQQSFQFDFDSVKKTFPNFKNLLIVHTGSFNYNQLILQMSCSTENIAISSNCFEDSRIPHRILIQNFAHFQYLPGPLTHMALNDLLVNNSKRIKTPTSQISSKEFNRFLKLWIKGANPRLEFLSVVKSDGNTLGPSVFMNGIRHQKMPRSLRRTFRFSSMKSLSVVGGTDVHRMDGRKATIIVSRKEGRVHFLMFVWHDHCIVL